MRRTAEDQTIIETRYERFAHEVVRAGEKRRDRWLIDGGFAAQADTLLRWLDDYRHGDPRPEPRDVEEGYGTCGPYYVR